MRRQIIWSCIGIIACLATFPVANWIKPIASFLPSGLLPFVFIALAAGMCVAGQRAKWMYAFFEFYVGLFALASAALIAPTTDSYNPEQRNFFFIFMMGGIFLVAQGFDDGRQAWPAVKARLEKWGFIEAS